MPFQILRANIADLPIEVDVIVNSADTEPKYNFGVDRAIYLAAGEKLLTARKIIGKIAIGDIQITDSFNLKNTKKIFHVVAPVYQGGYCDEMKTLRACYQKCFKLALKEKFSSLAVPILGNGNNGFPTEEALRVAIAESVRFLLENESFDFKIILVIFDNDTLNKCQKIFGVDFIKEYISNNDVKEMKNADEKAGAKTFHKNQTKRTENKKLDKNFIEKLAELMGRIGRSLENDNDLLDILHLGNIPERVFYSIKEKNEQGQERIINEKYNPSKATAIRFAIALQLSTDDAADLINAAGWVLYNRNTLDKKIKNFIYQKNKPDQKKDYTITKFEEEIPDFVTRERNKRRRK